ncbi:hypothetical protein [Streptomyces sp. Tue6028]|uniref:hypothetical protein n=1 Tax=Streptomyces sp. Tue6028 TaxID=2036037 RepID=UPI003EB9E564
MRSRRPPSRDATSQSSSILYRRAIWTKPWSSSAKHTFKIAVVVPSGRPTVTTDGLVYIK